MIFYRVYVRYTEVQSVIKINMVKWKIFKSLLLTSGKFKWKLIPQARLESKNKTHNTKKNYLPNLEHAEICGQIFLVFVIMSILRR